MMKPVRIPKPDINFCIRTKTGEAERFVGFVHLSVICFSVISVVKTNKFRARKGEILFFMQCALFEITNKYLKFSISYCIIVSHY